MPKLLLLFICVIPLITGCSTTGERELPPDFGVTNVIQSPPVTKTTVTPPPAKPVPLRTNEFPETWVAINRWTQARNLNPASRVLLNNCTAFVVQTDSGTLILQRDSQTAYWDEVKLYLGFGPKLIGDQLCVHRLDLLKNLEPLLREAAFQKTNRVIVIDPGHGGINSGAGSAFLPAHNEKEFTLDWALRLAPLLETNGWQVYLTRTNDVDVSLADRVAIAEAHQADLFVSLHFNSAAPDEREAGLETYCLTPTGMSSTLTRGYPDDVAKIYPNNAFDEMNWSVAFHLHRALIRAIELNDRGLRHARFMGMLRGQNRPSLLIEGGYLSNPTEARQIADPAFRQKLAEVIAEALK